MKSSNSAGNRILGIVVTYHPDALLPDRVKLLAEQAGSVLIVDNHSGGSAASTLREAASLPKVNLLVNSDNIGVAAALNIGVRYAIEAGYEWVATFDQDSSIQAGYFENLLDVHNSSPDRDTVAMLVPVYLEQAIGKVSLPTEDLNNPSVEVENALTSGSLIKVGCFLVVGLFDETLFIDYVDHEFNLRLMRAGYRIIRSNTCVLLHRLGRMTLHQVLGRRFYTYDHDSNRRYYVARNRLLVYRKYLTFRPLWVLKDLGCFAKDIVKIAFAERNAAAKLSATMRGLCHGVLGRSGRLDLI